MFSFFSLCQYFTLDIHWLHLHFIMKGNYDIERNQQIIFLPSDIYFLLYVFYCSKMNYYNTILLFWVSMIDHFIDNQAYQGSRVAYHHRSLRSGGGGTSYKPILSGTHELFLIWLLLNLLRCCFQWNILGSRGQLWSLKVLILLPCIQKLTRP